MEDTKSVARAFYEAVTSGNPDALDAVCSPDLRGHAGAGATLQDLKWSIGSFGMAFPDEQIQIRQLVAEGDLVSTWVTYSGTHKGPFAGVPASGASVKFAAWDLMRVKDGQIVELTQYCDLFTLMNQIGALPTAAPA
ncbi:MAG: ester cyclase [Nocardioidaceae bacterium]